MRTKKRKPRRVKKPLTPEQVEKRKKVFHLFDRLVIGAVKIWLNGTPWIVAVDEVDEFIKSKIEEIGNSKN